MTTLRDEATRLLSKMKESTRINGSVTCWLIPDNVLNDFRAALASSTPDPRSVSEPVAREALDLAYEQGRRIGREEGRKAGIEEAAAWLRGAAESMVTASPDSEVIGFIAGAFKNAAGELDRHAASPRPSSPTSPSADLCPRCGKEPFSMNHCGALHGAPAPVPSSGTEQNLSAVLGTYYAAPVSSETRTAPEAPVAGKCLKCGGDVLHRPGQPGEYDHDCGRDRFCGGVGCRGCREPGAVPTQKTCDLCGLPACSTWLGLDDKYRCWWCTQPTPAPRAASPRPQGDPDHERKP